MQQSAKEAFYKNICKNLSDPKLLNGTLFYFRFTPKHL